MKNPVILIQADATKGNVSDLRNKAMDTVMSHGLENYDACGSRAVVWSDSKGKTERKLKAIVEKIGKINDVKLSVIEDPGLGIMLPGDFD